MSVTTEDTTQSPPEELPTDPAEYWGALPPEILAVDLSKGPELPVIDQLGSAPFKKEKGGFPFLGFLASVYEHVSTTALADLHAPAVPSAAAANEAATTESDDAAESSETQEALSDSNDASATDDAAVEPPAE